MRGYSGTWAVAGVGFALATGVAYLRIAADQHYLTDVVAGAVIGGLVG
jgi:membrane-associated phospholipid phosphatase